MDTVESFQRVWPRLYLDTAILNGIGRGHIAEGTVDELLRVARDRAIVVVVTDAHMRDAMKPGDSNAPGMLANILERFWRRGLVTKGPGEIEPWQSGPADIDVEPWGNVREVLSSDASIPFLVQGKVIQSITHAGDVALKSEQRAGRALQPKQSRLSNVRSSRHRDHRNRRIVIAETAAS